MNTNLPPYKIFSGTKSHYLAEAICAELGVELGKMNIQRFADGEFEVSFEESIRGCEVFLVQSTFPNTDNLMELLLMIDAAKRASAKSVIAVIPYFGWARQDRKDKPRVSIAAKLVADLLSTAGIDRLITMDLHADQIQGFFNVPVDHLYASSVFIPYIESLNLKDLEGYPQVRFRQESSGIHFDEDPLEVLPDQQVIYSNDRGSVMNLLCASDSYASGLGIVNSFIKDQIVLLPLKDSPKHTLGFVTNNKQKQSTIIQAFIEEIRDSLLPHH